VFSRVIGDSTCAWNILYIYLLYVNGNTQNGYFLLLNGTQYARPKNGGTQYARPKIGRYARGWVGITLIACPS